MTVKREKKDLKVLFVDWYRTLCSCPFFHNLQKVNPKLFQKLDDKMFDELPLSLLVDWMRGKVNKNDILQRMADEEMSFDEIGRLLKYGAATMKFDNEAFIPLIQRLRQKGLKVVIATDNTDVFCDYTVPGLKLHRYFDGIISSNQVGYVKSDVFDGKMLFFDKYLTENNCSYSEAMLLDDSAETCRLCKNFGMRSRIIRSSADMMMVLTGLDKKTR